MPIAVRNILRADPRIVDAIGAFGVATVHEAQDRTGLMASRIRPIARGQRMSGSAVTVSVPPGDNWMLQVAIELAQPGDVLIVAPTTPSEAGYFGELLGVLAAARGIRGLVIDACCRDIAALEELGFPVWSKGISAMGTVKATLGSVNVTIACADALVRPGDVVIADDDGVVIVPRADAERVLMASKLRDEKEVLTRSRYAAGELSLDVHDMRGALADAGLVYVDSEPER